ncbi:MAG: hypothetical protein ACOCRO_04465 [Halanaerobiales bacterium]
MQVSLKDQDFEKLVEKQEFILDRLKYASMTYLSHIPEDDKQANVFIDYTCKNLALRLDARITGKDCESSYIRYPKTWWQAFKKAYFPNFLIKMFPIVYTEVNIYGRINIPSLPFKDKEKDIYLTYETKRHETYDDE